MAEALQNLWPLLMAFGLGLLIGIERGWHMREKEEGRRIAGIRTFSLIGLFGGLSAYLSLISTPWLLVLGTGGMIVFAMVAYYLERGESEDRGATTEIAAFITFLLGVLAVLGPAQVVIALTVLVLITLGLKAPVHKALKSLDKREISAFFQLVILSVLFLPFLPNRGFGPGQTLNPFEIWLMVVFIQAIGFFGHFAIRIWGARVGTQVMGLFGGLASTTALTVTAARLARKKGADHALLAACIASASVVMFVRTGVLIGIVHTPLLKTMALPLGLGVAGCLIMGAIFHRKAARKKSRAEQFNPPPSDLTSAFGFGALLALVLVLTFYAREYLSGGGVLALSAISGLVDIDAITISFSKLASQDQITGIARPLTFGILVALFANSVSKTAIAAGLGKPELGKKVGILYGAAFLAVAAGVLVQLI